jgi:DNA-binding beta-propeller fold protein YncE
VRRQLLTLYAATALFAGGCGSGSTQPPPPDAGTIAGDATATGKAITPTAARGAVFQDLNPNHAAAPELRANHAVAVAVSPDGRWLAVLTSGFNRRYGADGALVPELSTEYVFLFDITGARPRQVQVLPLANTFQGLVWAPDAQRLYAAGGKDDVVYEFSREGETWGQRRTIRLNHGAPAGVPMGGFFRAEPMAGALAISADGKRMLVANFYHDSVSLIDLGTGSVVVEQDLRPGKIDPALRGTPGGTYPRSVVWTSSHRAYVASERDRELIGLVVHGDRIQVSSRVAVKGQPVALLSNRTGSRLYAALDNSDGIAILDTEDDELVEEVGVVAPDSIYVNTEKLGGTNANALVLTPDERTLLVSNGGQNALAVVRLSNRGMGAHDEDEGKREAKEEEEEESAEPRQSAVVGLIPTGWYPTGVAISRDGATWYVVNGKSMPGPNDSWCADVDPVSGTCVSNGPSGEEAANGQAFLRTRGQTVLQRQKAGLLAIPAPDPLELARLTKQVARNNGFDRPDKTAADERLFAFLRERVTHVIYIVKENRSYDQILGDLEIGNGDPRLAIFPERITPNQHALARTFVTLDNFLVSGEGSWTGWQWSTAARTTDFAERSDFLALGNRGSEMAIWGINRGVNMSLESSAERKKQFSRSPSDPDVLPGARDVGAPDGPGGEEGKGYIWDAALRAGLSVRNYGFNGDIAPGWAPGSKLPLIRDPFAAKTQVFFPANTSLKPHSDIYYRMFDFSFPDHWRVQEWKREYRSFVASGQAPHLMLVQLGGNHTGNFDTAIDGVDTPDTQVADNDYALAQIVETVAAGPFAASTVIVSVEDDTWDGPDHVDAFRSPVFFAGAYVRRGALISTRYTTVNVVKTIEAILGIGPVGLNDALAVPMSEVFDPSAAGWTFKAIVPGVLRTTKLSLPPPSADRADTCVAPPRRTAAYWAKAMASRDFSHIDAGEFGSGNEALWRGLQGDVPYPAVRTGEDLRDNRRALLNRFRTNEECKPGQP